MPEHYHLHLEVLCHERLEKMLWALEEAGGWMTQKNLRWHHGIRKWEVKHAEQLGWVRRETRQLLRGGTPSVRVFLTDDVEKAWPPPYSYEILLPISARHRRFAELTLEWEWNVGRGKGRAALPFRLRRLVSAYREVYPGVRNEGAARSAASRLFRHREVQAVRTWLMAQAAGTIGKDEWMPGSAVEVEERLEDLGVKG